MVFLCMCLFYAFRTSDLEKMKEEGRREKKHTHDCLNKRNVGKERKSINKMQLCMKVEVI